MDERPPQWSKHFDIEFKTYYWHNSDTKQSVWCEDEEDAYSSKSDEEQKDHLGQTNDKKINTKNSLGEVELRDLKKSDSSNNNNSSSRTESSSSSGGNNNRSTSNQRSDDSALLLTQNSTDSFEILISPELSPTSLDEIHISTSRDVLIYSICIFVNAFIVEGPLALLEGILRFILFLTGSILTLVSAGFLCRKSLLSTSFLLFRESVLCAAAAITLLLPGTSCLVYRNYHTDNEWELSPLPTILGFVDARRFCSFVFGNGSFASNVRHDNYLYDEEDHNRAHTIQYTSSQEQNHLDRICQDSWKINFEGNNSTDDTIILLEPRRLQANVIRIVRGEDHFGILFSSSSSNIYSIFGSKDEGIVEDVERI